METTEKKYELTDETIEAFGRTLYRIKALRDFGGIKTGDLGGFIEKEENLSHIDNAWVYYNALVYGDAQVFGNAMVFGNARVFGNASVYGRTMVCGHARVCGDSEVCGNAEVCSDSDYILFKNWWSSGRFFTWTRSNNMWKVGCFYGTGEQLIEKAYKDSELSGREYERVVRYVESILADEKKVGTDYI